MDRKEFISTSLLATGGLCSLGFSEIEPQGIGNRNFLLNSIEDANAKNICKTCGTRYAKHLFDKDKCPVCLDERQYLKSYGQQWVSYDELAQGHSVKVHKRSENVYELKIVPDFAIGQRAFFIKSESGNILWDCIPFIDQPIVDFIKNNGGLSAIAISHPHYYSLMNEWRKTFDCPIYLHKNDERWIMDDMDDITLWEGDKQVLNKNATIHKTGGHFPGSCVLETALPYFKKSLFIGDTIYLSRDKKHISAMFSYPNVIPLSNKDTQNVFNQINRIEFDSLFGAFTFQNLEFNAQEVFKKSFELYKNLAK